MIFEQCKVGRFFAWAGRDPSIKSPVYKHFTICFSFFGDAVNHLIYSGSKTDPSRVARCKPQRSITPINEFL